MTDWLIWGLYLLLGYIAWLFVGGFIKRLFSGFFVRRSSGSHGSFIDVDGVYDVPRFEDLNHFSIVRNGEVLNHSFSDGDVLDVYGNNEVLVSAYIVKRLAEQMSGKVQVTKQELLTSLVEAIKAKKKAAGAKP